MSNVDSVTATAGTAHGRFATLDAMRGVAAILVMLFHLSNWFGGLAPVAMAGGYLAVDLFFILSGFVLAHAYERRLADGLSMGGFFRFRLIRMWPLAALSALFAVAVHGAPPTMIFLIPDFRATEGLFPANPPMWSLLLELLVNLAWALVATRLSNARLGLVVVASGAILAFTIPAGGVSEFGAFWNTVIPGLVRTVFSFSLGIALYRLHRRRPAPALRSWTAWLVLAGLVLVLAVAPAARGPWDALSIYLLLPALVWLGIRIEFPQPRIAATLGDLSYPLYCIHVPLIVLLPETSLAIGAASPGLIVLAWLLDRWFDRPVRAALAKALVARAG